MSDMLEQLPDTPMVIAGKHFEGRDGYITRVEKFNPYRCGIKYFDISRRKKTGYISSWRGHRKKGKFIYVIKGQAIVQLIRITDLEGEEPEFSKKVHQFILYWKYPNILWIPPGFCMSYKTLKPNTDVMIFSTRERNVGGTDKHGIPIIQTTVIRMDSQKNKSDGKFYIPWFPLGKQLWENV